MNVEYVPLLALQRDLYRTPRGIGRFRRYLETIVDWKTESPRFPSLVAMNPMAKDHVPALLDDYLTLDADTEAARIAAETADALDGHDGPFQITLTLLDDRGGGWTNRAICEFAARFGSEPSLRAGWILPALWSSEPASLDNVRNAVRLAIHRAAHVLNHGEAPTLAARMDQEGRVMVAAGVEGPALDDDDREYTRQVLQPYLHDTDMRRTVECLFGDQAARPLGFTPLGLSPNAGLALACHDALRPATSLRG
jgi:hypothetical protein